MTRNSLKQNNILQEKKKKELVNQKGPEQIDHRNQRSIRIGTS